MQTSTELPRVQVSKSESQPKSADQGGTPKTVAPLKRVPYTGVGDVEMPDAGQGEVMQHRADPAVRPPQADISRFPEALSSPGSTTQTAATPAPHDASTDTSPEHEGVQYTESEPEKQEPQQVPQAAPDRKDDEGLQRGTASPEALAGSESPSAGADALSAVHSVEAQLLQESAAAAESASGRTSQTKPQVLVKDPVADDKPRPAATSSSADASSPQREARPVSDAPASPPKSQKIADISTDGQGLCPVPTPPIAVSPQQEIKPQPTEQPSTGASIPATAAPSSEESSDFRTEKSMADPEAQPARPARTQPDSVDIPISDPNPDAQEAQPENLAVHSALEFQNLPEKPTKPKIPVAMFGDKKSKLPMVRRPLKDGEENKSSNPFTEDYFTTLFVQGFTQNAKWMKPIDSLLNSAHKTLSTADAHLSIMEQQACRVLRRVYHLQQQDKWSLRQPRRYPEPRRPVAHWDQVLEEMKWMRTDFRQERKWKRSAARVLAFACADWVAADDVKRKLLQVPAIIPKPAAARTVPGDDSGQMEDVDMPDQQENEVSATKQKTASGLDTDMDNENSDEPGEVYIPAMDDEEQISVTHVVPAQIFALPDTSLTFSFSNSSAFTKILDELPMYGGPLQIPDNADLLKSDQDPDAHWKLAAVPLTKYVERPMVPVLKGPPTKRSRYQFAEESDSDAEDEDNIVYRNNRGDTAGPLKGQAVERELKHVALFDPEMQVLRDRLHAGHQFRPPTEHPMPLQSFYESRTASQWTYAEDDQLKRLVREYSYNWSLISSKMAMPSLFSSGAERRTPWECFERWVHLEGLPNDMAKTQYFKTYQYRIDQAQAVIAAKNQIAQAQAGPGAVTPVPRKRLTTTIRVERRRAQKHLTLLDAMRKLAKKREATAHKTASVQAMRKQNESQQQQQQQNSQAQQPRGPNKTPRDYSLMRYERDQQINERMAQFAQKQQQEAQRKVRRTGPIFSA